MKNVQQLLDELGSPPPEICLDWAWQLVQLSSQPNCPQSLSWCDLQVAHQGSLEIVSPSAVMDNDTTSIAGDPHSLIRGLLQWAGLNESELSQINTLEACQSAIETLTAQHINSQATSRAGTSRSRATAISETTSTQSVNSTDDVDIGLVEATTSLLTDENDSSQLGATFLDGSPTPADSIKPTTKKSVKAKPGISKNHRIALLSLGGVGILLVAAIAFFYTRSSNSKSDSLASRDSAATSEVTTPDDSTNKAKTKSSRSTSSDAEIDDTLSGNDRSGTGRSSTDRGGTEPGAAHENIAITEITSLDSEQLSELSLSQSVGTGSASKTLGSIIPSGHIEVDKSNPSSNDAPTTSSERSATTLGDEKTQGEAQPKAVDADAAMATTSKESVAGLLKSVTSDDTKVNTLDADSDNDGPRKLPVQLLNVESMFQVQELTAKLRVRQPTWQLRIASTAAFSVDPPGLQSLAEKETVRWILTAKELKPRKGQEPTQVVVLAQLTGRKADIRWTIAAGSQDLPGIAVPLNEFTLDQMLTVLQGYQQRLTASIDQIKAAVEVAEFPKEQKSLLTAQRRAMENEGKLVTRARQVIADASMFASWMDRSVEVHGVLSDQVGGQPTVVLELGQPVESKVKVDDSNDAKQIEPTADQPANK